MLLIQNIIPLGCVTAHPRGAGGHGRWLTTICGAVDIGRVSLFMQLEVARLLQGWLISSDNEMYYAEKDIYAKVQSSTLNEELGQVRPRATRATAVERAGWVLGSLVVFETAAAARDRSTTSSRTRPAR